MYKLTARREAKALPILEAAYESLVMRGGFDFGKLERDLRACWNVGYHALYDILEDAFKDEHWLYVAVYYMERVHPSPTCELQRALAKAYGMNHWSFGNESAIARAEFWKNSGITVK